MRRVVIHWLDIQTDHGWEAKADSLKPAECESIGFLMHESDEYVTLAGTRHARQEETNCRICIPKGCIVRREELD